MTTTPLPVDASCVMNWPRLPRAAIAVALVAGAVAGFALGARDISVMDVELLRLLRAMAILKIAFIVLAAGAVLWRLQAPIRPVWLAAYACAGFATAVGPPLIWFSSHIVLAAVLLHGGLISTCLLLWRDDVTAELLRTAIFRRRTRLLGKARPSGQ